MDNMEMKLSLRIVDQLIKDYSKINLISSTTGMSLSPKCAELLKSTWITNLKDELKKGKYINLSSLVSNIRKHLEDCIRGLEPLMAVFCRVLSTEYALECEIKKLPKKLALVCNRKQEKNLNNKMPPHKKNTYLHKRKGGKKNFVLRSQILNNTIISTDINKHDSININVANNGESNNALNSGIILEIQDTGPSEEKNYGNIGKLMGNTICSQLANETQNNVVVEQENEPLDPKSKNRLLKRKKKTGVISLSNTTTTRSLRGRNILPKENKVNATENQTEYQTEKSNSVSFKGPLQTQETKNQEALNYEKLVINYESIIPDENISLGSAYVNMNIAQELPEKILSPTENCETASRTCFDKYKSVTQPQIKRKRVTYKDFDNHLLNLKRKVKNPNSEIQTEFSSTVSFNDLHETPTMTDPNKGLHLTREIPVIEMKYTFAEDYDNLNRYDIEKQKIEENLERGNDSTFSNSNDKCIRKGMKNKLKCQNLLPKTTNELIQYPKKKKSRFISKGNHLMGIEDEDMEEIQAPKKQKLSKQLDDATSNILTNKTKHFAENPEVKIVTHSANKNNHNDNSVESMKKQTENGTPEEEVTFLNEIYDLTKCQDQIDESMPEVIRVVEKQGHEKKMKEIKDLDVKIEKVILKETISDDEHPEDSSSKNDQSLIKNTIKDLNVQGVDIKGTKGVEKLSNSDRKISNKKEKAKLTYTKKDKERKVIERKFPSNLLEKTEKETALKSNKICMDNSQCNEKETALKSNVTYLDNSQCNENDIIASEIFKKKLMAELWMASTLNILGEQRDELRYLAEIPEVSCFLHMCQKVLCLPIFTHFEFEHAILIPHASSLMAAIITALLSGAPGHEARTITPLTYLEWNRKLTAKMSHWYLIEKQIQSHYEVYDLIGVEVNFWKVLGSQINPLTLKTFHQLPIKHRVTILKGLCDHLLHVSKRIQTALLSTPNNGREGEWLGEDTKGTRYVFFPIFFHHGIGDLRIYQMEQEYIDDGIIDIKEEMSIKTKNNCNSDEKQKAEKEGKTAINYSKKKFCLVANDLSTLDELVRKICSSFSNEEIIETEKQLSMKISMKDIEKMEEETTNQECNDLENIQSSIMAESMHDLSPRNKHLLLASQIRFLAKEMHKMVDSLNKSQTAALVKLHTEWIEFHKDRNCISKEDSNKIVKKQNKNKSEEEKKTCNTSEKRNDNDEDQQVPRRASLSRKAKHNAECQIKDGTQQSRKAMLEAMEEDALMGRTNMFEELKWDISLWADEESEEDLNEKEEESDKDFIWYGYAAVQNQDALKGTNTSNIKWSLPLGKQKRSPKFKSLNKVQTEPLRKLKVKQQKNNQNPTSYSNYTVNTFEINIKKEDIDMLLSNPEKDHTINSGNLVQNNQMELIDQIGLMQANMQIKSSSPHTLVIKKQVDEHEKPPQLIENILKSYQKVKEKSKDIPANLLELNNEPSTSTFKPINVVKLKMPKLAENSGRGKKYSKTEMDSVTNMFLGAMKKIIKESSVIVTENKETAENTTATDTVHLKSENFEKSNPKSNEILKSEETKCSVNLPTITKVPSSSEIDEESQNERKISLSTSLDQHRCEIDSKEKQETATAKNLGSGFKPFSFKSITLKDLKLNISK